MIALFRRDHADGLTLRAADAATRFSEAFFGLHFAVRRRADIEGFDILRGLGGAPRRDDPRAGFRSHNSRQQPLCQAGGRR